MKRRKVKTPHHVKRAMYERVETIVGEQGGGRFIAGPVVHEAEATALLERIAAGLQYNPRDDDSAAILYAYEHSGAWLMWIRRRLRRERDAKRNAGKGCNPAGVGITIQQDRIEREQPQYRPGS
jgi:hypothetical protein